MGFVKMSEDKKAFHVIVKLFIKEDRVEEFGTLIADDAVKSRLEEGCIRFDVMRDRENKCIYHLYEVYKNAAAFDFHKETEHFGAFKAFGDSGGLEKPAEVTVPESLDIAE